MEKLNIKITLSYDGTDFSGFQSQKNCRTVEDELKNAISKILKEETVIHCAGRTDTGVHAEGQVVNFHVEKRNMQEVNWLQALNSILPKDIRITKCEFVDLFFHARRNAIYREYWYNIIDSKTISALLNRYVSHFFYFKLDENLLQSYGNTLIGENNFSSFCAANDSSLSKNRYIHSIRVERTNDLVTIKIIANAFLQHMIRIIVGTMLNLHKNNQPPEKMTEILKARNRNASGPTYYSKGLVFKKVYYDETILKKEYVVPDHGFKLES